MIALAESYRSDLDAWVRQDLHARVRIVLAVLTLLTSGPLLGLAVYCWRAAKTRGRMLRFLALFSGGSGLLLAFLLWRFLFLIEQTTAPR